MTGTEIEFNADIGEGFGVWAAPMQIWRADLERGGSLDPEAGGSLPSIERVMHLVSSVNLSCGFHAGDPYLIKRYVAAAKAAGCAIGAHPSYPDLAGFGLRYMDMGSEELQAIVQYQLGALEGFLRMEGMMLHHVKCHGALYNRAVKDQVVADAVVEAVVRYREGLPLYGFPYSCLEQAAERFGVPFVREAFSDRAYHENGSLVDRRRGDAMITDPALVIARVLRMAREGRVDTVEGSDIELNPATICFHADTPAVLEFLEGSIRILKSHNVVVRRDSLAAARNENAVQ